jgi:uncharacterized protein with von Willebrand factor type A (vWA) domain
VRSLAGSRSATSFAVEATFGTVGAMRIAGVRVGPPAVRLLAQILDDAGYEETARTLTEAIALAVVEPALTLADHEAILTALGDDCPTSLAKLRRELLDGQARRRRAGF